MSFANQALSAEYVAQPPRRARAAGLRRARGDRRRGRPPQARRARHRARADDAGAGRYVASWQHGTVTETARAAPSRPTGPGARRSGSRTSSATSSASASRGSTATTSTGSRGGPTEGGRRVLVRADADGSTADLTPPPFNVRTRVHEYGGGVVRRRRRRRRLLRLRRRPAVPARSGRGRAGRRSRRRGRGATRTSAPTSAGAGSTRSARTTSGRAARRSTRIVAIPLDGGDPRVLVKGPDFFASPRLSPGRHAAWPGSSGTTRTCRGTRRGCGSRRSSPTARSASRRWPPAARTSRSSSPSGRPTARSTSISDRSGWWNLYRLVDGPRLEPLAPMEAEFADPAWIFGRSSYGFLPDGSIVAVARHGGRDQLVRIEPGRRSLGEVETPFTRARRAAGRRRRDRRASPAAPGRPVGRRPVRPGRRWRPPASCAARAPSPSIRRRSRTPSRSSSRRPAAGPRTPSTTRRRNPEFVGPDGRAAAARRAVARRPDRRTR